MHRLHPGAAVASVKRAIGDFWDRAPCGASLHLAGQLPADYAAQAAARYALEPCIPDFAGFDRVAGKDVLEIGVGLGADHERFAEGGAELVGVDLTEAAIEHTERRLAQRGLGSDLRVADAEALPFADASFDLVYSWGVIHHTPDTARAAREALRVLRPGGRYAIMIYNRWSLVGLMLWLRYGVLQRRTLDEVYARYLESPGTKAFSRAQARAMFPGASVRTLLSPGDLIEGGAGQRHRGLLLTVARRLWPRFLIRRFGTRFGLFLLIDGRR